MEKDTVTTSEASTANGSTGGFQKALHRRSFQTKHLWETTTFVRFLRTPLILSSICGILVWVSCIMTAVRFAPEGAWGVVMIVTGTMVGLPIGGLTRMLANTVMIRERLRAWIGDKFNSWDDAGRWMAMTQATELDWLASQPDDSWTPDTLAGGAKS